MIMVYRQKIFFLLMLGIVGCVESSKSKIFDTSHSQLALRQIQSRAFDTTNRTQTLRTIIATMQDLGFVIDKADEDLGAVSATKLSGYNLRLTVTIHPRGNTQTIVRASAQYNTTAVEDPEPYQQFFTSLERAMFLTAHSVD